MTENNMSSIFLSASIPYPDTNREPEKYYDTMDATAIRESILALTRVFLPHHHLVFGGHPAISPFILQIAEQFGDAAMKRVHIYQSEFFRKHIPKESQAFPNLIWTDAKADKPSSLEHMRREMIGGQWHYLVGIFIGGMDGVEKEFDLFRQLKPNCPVYPITSTGAAAGILYNNNPSHPSDPNLRQMLKDELAYRHLFKTIRMGLI